MYPYSMTPLEIFTALGAIRVNGHFVYTSGRHGATYVNKDAIYPHTKVTANLCLRIAFAFAKDNIDVVAGPAVGGVILSQGIANQLCYWNSRGGDVLSVYAEKDKSGQFVFGRGYGALLPGKRVLLVEDVLTTGGSVTNLAAAARACGGDVIGVGALVNRGGLTAEALGVPKFMALLDLPFDTCGHDECPLCAIGVPIDTTVGNGAAFVAAKKTVLASPQEVEAVILGC